MQRSMITGAFTLRGVARAAVALAIMLGLPLTAHAVTSQDIVQADREGYRGAPPVLVRGKNLEVIRPPDADAVTVEVFARWAHDYLADAIRDSGAHTLAVRVWENSMSFGGYSDQLD